MTASQSPVSQALVFEVTKTALNKTRILPLNIDLALSDNEVLLKVDKFALTANNISYGIAGDDLGYWRFFPTEKVAEQEQWDDYLLWDLLMLLPQIVSILKWENECGGLCQWQPI